MNLLLKPYKDRFDDILELLDDPYQRTAKVDKSILYMRFYELPQICHRLFVSPDKTYSGVKYLP